MTLQEIKDAITRGDRVFWKTVWYEVLCTINGNYIIHHKQGHVIGLTWEDGTTMNSKEEDFFIQIQK